MSDEQDPLGVHIGAREIYDQVVGIRDDVRSLVEEREDTARKLEDHEERLRGLERFKNSVPLASVAALLTAGASLLKGSGII